MIPPSKAFIEIATRKNKMTGNLEHIRLCFNDILPFGEVFDILGLYMLSRATWNYLFVSDNYGDDELNNYLLQMLPEAKP